MRGRANRTAQRNECILYVRLLSDALSVTTGEITPLMHKIHYVRWLTAKHMDVVIWELSPLG